MSERIGYFGGTFDPPHRAHLLVAQAAADAFALDRVLLAPTGVQPLKSEAPVASFADRLAMVRLLCGEHRPGAPPDLRLQASEADAPHADGSANYTVEALERVRTQHPGAALFAVVGADSFQSLPHWRDPERLFSLAEWIVVSRPGEALDWPADLRKDAESRVHFLQTVDEDIAATDLRNRLRVGAPYGKALTPAVVLYIARMRLYGAGSSI